MTMHRIFERTPWVFGILALAMVVAIFARPRLPESDLDSPVGTKLNAVDDPLRAG